MSSMATCDRITDELTLLNSATITKGISKAIWLRKVHEEAYHRVNLLRLSCRKWRTGVSSQCLSSFPALSPISSKSLSSLQTETFHYRYTSVSVQEWCHTVHWCRSIASIVKGQLRLYLSTSIEIPVPNVPVAMTTGESHLDWIYRYLSNLGWTIPQVVYTSATSHFPYLDIRVSTPRCCNSTINWKINTSNGFSMWLQCMDTPFDP